MSNTVFVAGVGMTPFVKPGTEPPYTEMGAAAVRMALEDAGLDYGLIQQAYAGYVYGDSTAGQAVLYQVGMTGIPVINVNNNCSTGSTALYLARQAVQSGVVDCALALGFEQMSPGALGSVFADRPSPFDRFDEATEALVGHGEIPLALRYFGGAWLKPCVRFMTSTCLSIGLVRSVHLLPSAPFSICSKPTASTQSESPPATACRARNSAVEPVEQLLLTLTTGMPDRPTSYSVRCPQVESP